MRVLIFWFVGVSRACCGGRTGFWWCQVALVSVVYVLALGSCHLVISGVSWYSCPWLWLVPSASLCVSTPSISVLSGRNSLCGPGSTLGTDRNPRDTISDFSLVPVIWGLWSGPSEQIGSLICAYRFVITTWRLTLYWQYFGIGSWCSGIVTRSETRCCIWAGKISCPRCSFRAYVGFHECSSVRKSRNHRITWG